MSAVERLRGMLAMAVASDDAFNRLSPAGFRLLQELLIVLNPKGEAISAVIDEGYLWGFEEGGRIERERADFLEADNERLRSALETIAGSHDERVGYCPTDMGDVPDLNADEAMKLARAALNSGGPA